MNYTVYRYDLKEYLIETGRYLGLVLLFSFFFYRSLFVFLISLLFLPLFLKLRKKTYIKKRKDELELEFTECLKSVGANMRAGYSMENAFVEAEKDISMFFGKDCLMAAEIQKIRKGLKVNITIEELLYDLGERSGSEDIEGFSKLVTTAKRNGGSMNDVFENTAGRLSDKRSFLNELNVIISEKQFELKIMKGIPFVILFYVDLTNRGYFDVLYSGIRGRIFMTLCVIVYFLAGFIADHILGFLNYERVDQSKQKADLNKHIDNNSFSFSFAKAGTAGHK